ncbi:hypothetical protein [Virgibacillus salexigens]|uniref:F5/8 type C domain protein n=1 Tax=Virgibacillus massiliensis TaxID=1462526 RepID=A0A024QH10_9BACI|nr:hypothetical protein [Virgibacillus massiliensis]CDQ41799.1 hypothetical protein BN990_04176 [Virgibacillus massiliensis]
MDIISYQKAAKAKREIKLTQDKLGMNGTEQDKDIKDKYENVDNRITALEEKDPGVELVNRVSDVSIQTSINLNKYNLKVNSLLNLQRYKLKDLIVDDFADESGIDSSLSINYFYDKDNNLIRIAEEGNNAEIVTIKEDTEGIPEMVMVSKETSEPGIMQREVDLAKGTFTNTVYLNGQLKLEATGEQVMDGYKNAVPMMISETAPEGLVFASTYYASNYPYQAFNGVASDFWNTTSLGNFVGYIFESPKVIKQISLTARNDTLPSRTPTSFRIEASKDTTNGTDGNWVEIAQFSEELNWAIGEKRIYQLNNEEDYISYRILILDAQRTDYPTIAELEFIEENYLDRYYNEGTYESNIIDLGRVSTISELFSGYSDNLVPVLEQNESAEGFAFASDYYDYGDYPRMAWRAFNNNVSDFWNTERLNNYVGFCFNYPQLVKQISISARATGFPERTPSAFRVQGSFDTTDGNDGIWEDIQTFHNEENWFGGETRYFTLNNSKSYKAYRVYVLDAERIDFPTIAELQFYGYKNSSSKIDLLISTSLDGINYSEYKIVDSGGKSETEKCRYVRLKVILKSGENNLGTPNIDRIKLLYKHEFQKQAILVSRNNGLNWVETKEDELTYLSNQPEGSELRVKIILESGQELHGLSYAWI